jgi:hypothetical protein
MSVCTKRGRIAAGRDAVCRVKRNGNLPPCRNTLIFAGAICGSGPTHRLHPIRDFQQMLIWNIRRPGLVHIRCYAAHHLPLNRESVHRVTAIFLRLSVMIFLLALELALTKFPSLLAGYQTSAFRSIHPIRAWHTINQLLASLHLRVTFNPDCCKRCTKLSGVYL